LPIESSVLESSLQEAATARVTLPGWIERIEGRTAGIGVIGLGYVGLPLALLFSEERFRVTGFDIDAKKVKRLNAGQSYIHRIEPEQIQAARSARFSATSDFSRVAEMDAVLICVPTPLHEDHTPDMSYIVATVEAIAPHLRAGQLVVLESTTYPGTTEEIVVETINRHGVGRGVRVLRDGGVRAHVSETRHGAPATADPTRDDKAVTSGAPVRYGCFVSEGGDGAGATADPSTPFGAKNAPNSAQDDTSIYSAQDDTSIYGAQDETSIYAAQEDTSVSRSELDGVMVAFSPEREDPGNVVTPRRDIPKVVGGVDRRAAKAAAALYGAVFAKTVMMSSPAAAEMTKLLENIYRSVNIALVNEMKQLCQKMGIDVWEVIDAAATKPFGFQAFYPGPGVGGHCIPVDPFYLSWKAEQYGFSTRFIELAGEVNESMPLYVVETAARALAGRGVELCGAKVLVLGVAYKRDVDDLRESPSLTIIELLQRAGAEVSYNDPFFETVGQGRKYTLNLSSTPLSRVGEFDCVVIATDHSEYDYEKIVAESRLVVDSRNATRGYDSEKIVRC